MEELIRNYRYLRTWAEIDLSLAEEAFRAVREATDAKIYCVIKANGYGHGAVRLAQLYKTLGADYFAVSNIDEALSLRERGIKLPILILGFTPHECAVALAENNIEQCVFSLGYAKELSEEAVRAGVAVKVHIKIDSGMGRIGFICRDGNTSGLEDALTACRLPGLITEGIFTHFAVADEGKDGAGYTDKQFESFMRAVNYLESNGVSFKVRHCANSAAIFDYPQYHLDMVRAGIVLYGLEPSDLLSNPAKIRPLMALRSVISNVKELQPNEPVSYGGKYVPVTSRKIATIPVGYADGLSRTLSGKDFSVGINGHRAPVVGRICMDQLMVDITDIDCKPGDIVTIFGEDPALDADDIANITGTINYEVVCDIGERVPRVYVKNGHIVAIEKI